ncbi:hypothetical protein MPER_13774, partial [Moniliophthora perniciosa FA553]
QLLFQQQLLYQQQQFQQQQFQQQQFQQQQFQQQQFQQQQIFNSGMDFGGFQGLSGPGQQHLGQVFPTSQAAQQLHDWNMHPLQMQGLITMDDERVGPTKGESLTDLLH